MRELRMLGSVRGARREPRPYRDSEGAQGNRAKKSPSKQSDEEIVVPDGGLAPGAERNFPRRLS